MYVRGEFHGTVEDLDSVICDVRDFAAANESYTDVNCLYDAIEYLTDILGADISE